MDSSKKFISHFKMNGIPILPPLMNEEKRREMLHYKSVAKAIENKLKSKLNHENKSSDGQYLSHRTEIEEQCSNASELLKKQCSPGKSRLLGQRDIQHLNLGKSETLVVDVVSNTVFIPSNENNVKNFPAITKFEESLPSMKTPAPKIIVDPPPLEEAITTSTNAEIQETKDDNNRQVTRVVDESSRRSTKSSGIEDPICARAYIRSNSFTLEQPSKALIQYIAKNLDIITANSPQRDVNLGQNEKKANRMHDEVKPKIKQSCKDSPQMSRNKNSSQLKSNSTSIKKTLFNNKKSPYEVKVGNRRKTRAAVSKSPPVTSSKLGFPHSKKNVQNEENCSVPHQVHNGTESVDTLDKAKIIKLIENKMNEQKRMQESFEKETKKLLKQLYALSPANKLLSKKQQETKISAAFSELLRWLETCTPGAEIKIRKSSLVKQNVNNTAICSQPKKYDPVSHYTKARLSMPKRSLYQVKSPKTVAKRKPTPSNKKRNAAATIINAYAKGYLVRRLLRTNYVQNIVKTIKDSLQLVLELYMENDFDNKLKVQLLLQLKASCYDLHNIFFDLSPKQKIDIIRRDRSLFSNNDGFLHQHNFEGIENDFTMTVNGCIPDVLYSNDEKQTV